MAAITTSVFELLKIGPGPSSSHTIGPMKAGRDFHLLLRGMAPELLDRAERLQILLHGSLAATGKGHGTDRAVLAGLMGHDPEDCPPDILDAIHLDTHTPLFLEIGSQRLPFHKTDLIFHDGATDFPYSNTMIIRLTGPQGTILEREYYSVGGGFIQWKGGQEPPRGNPRYPYENAAQLTKLLRKHRLALPDLMLANERAVTGRTEGEINDRLDRIIAAMEDAVRRGLQNEGYLPGPIRLHRKGPLFFQRARRMFRSAERLLVYLCAYAFAAAEENAAGHLVVTAPTCGSAGVIPALVYLLRRHGKVPLGKVRRALLGSAAVGFIAKHNASISGAEVGCQGEIGVAASMGAALVALANDADARIAENAAETALEHHLGMTCDPVQGYVQIPCIERNAMGAVKAYTSYLIAREGVPEWHLVSLDKAVAAMNMTGRDMPFQYRETSLGGLARCC